ncbi:MAG: hypothetical protein WC563_15370 [Brevundimonas sp.]
MASFWTGALSTLFNMAGMRGTANALVLDDGGVNGCTAPGDATNGLKVNVTTAALPPGAALDTSLAGIGLAADAKVDTDAAGTLSSKLRGIVSLLLATGPIRVGVDLVTTAVNAVTTKLGDATQIANVRSALGTWTPATAAAVADSGVIVAAACKVGRVQAVNSHATISYFLMLFDLAAVPANGTAPRYPAIPLVPGQALILPYGGATHAAGLCWAASTTGGTLTVSATTPFQVSAEIL